MDFWGSFVLDQKTVSDIYKLQEKFKNVFCNSTVNCEKSSNGMFHFNKDKIQEASSRYTNIEASNEQLVRLSIESQVGKR